MQFLMNKNTNGSSHWFEYVTYLSKCVIWFMYNSCEFSLSSMLWYGFYNYLRQCLFFIFLHLKMFVGINLMKSIFWPHQELSVSVHDSIFGGPWFQDECISFYYFYHIKPLLQNISNWLFHLLVVPRTFVFMFCATFLIFNLVGQYHLFPWIPACHVILMI